MVNIKVVHKIAFLLVFLGALNWGFVGIFDFNLISWLGFPIMAEKTVYALIGLAAVWEIIMHKENCKRCMMELL